MLLNVATITYITFTYTITNITYYLFHEVLFEGNRSNTKNKLNNYEIYN